jgi:hypothetical protein
MADFCRLFVFSYTFSRRCVVPALLPVFGLSLGVRCRSFPQRRYCLSKFGGKWYEVIVT